MKRKADVRIDQHDTLESRDDIIKLSGIRLQELATGRHIEKEIADRKATTHRARARLLPYYTGARQRQASTHLIFLTTGTQLDLRHRSNRRQGFASKAHRVQGEEVVSLTNLTGGMTFESQSGIRHGHTTTIIYYLNRSTAGIDDQHIDNLCTSINSILNQLLDDRSWSLNDLASSNLIGHTIRQKGNNVSHLSFS